MESLIILSNNDIVAIKEGKEVKVQMTDRNDVTLLSEYAYSEKFLKEISTYENMVNQLYRIRGGFLNDNK